MRQIIMFQTSIFAFACCSYCKSVNVMDISEKPKDHLWWLKGLQTQKNGSDISPNSNGVNRDTDNYHPLLHRMFERFLNETAGKGGETDGVKVVEKTENHTTALIEYVEGSTVENMRSITYAELNEKSNRLARLLIKTLGTQTITLKHNTILLTTTCPKMF